MNVNMNSLIAFIAAIVLYFLISPVLGLVSLLGLFAVTSSVVYAYSTRGFNKWLRKQVSSREYRYLGFYFLAAFVAFTGSDILNILLLYIGAPGQLAGVFNILGFFAIILWLTWKYFPQRVQPRLL